MDRRLERSGDLCKGTHRHRHRHDFDMRKVGHHNRIYLDDKTNEQTDTRDVISKSVPLRQSLVLQATFRCVPAATSEEEDASRHQHYGWHLIDRHRLFIGRLVLLILLRRETRAAGCRPTHCHDSTMTHRGDDRNTSRLRTGISVMMLRRIILVGVAYRSCVGNIPTTHAFGGSSVRSIAKLWGASWRTHRERAFLHMSDQNDKGDDDDTIPTSTKSKKSNMNMFQWKSDDKLSSALGINPSDNHNTSTNNKQPQPPSTPPPASVWKTMLPFFAASNKKETTKTEPIKEASDGSIPNDAMSAQLAFGESDKSLTFEEFQRQYEADTVAYVPSSIQQPPDNVDDDVLIPYDAAARLAYDNTASDVQKSMTFAQFKTKYEADAIALVKSKNKPSSTRTPPQPKQTPPPPKETTKPVMTPVKVEISNEEKKEKEARNKMITDAGNKIVKEVVTPLFSNDIEHGVSADVIKGATIVGATLSVFTGGSLASAGAAGLGAAYVAVTPGLGGDCIRTVGSVAWNTTQLALQLYQKYETNQKLTSATKAFISTAIEVMAKDSDGNPVDIKGAIQKAVINADREQLAALDAGVNQLISEAEKAVEAAEQAMMEKQKEAEIEAIQAEIEAEEAQLEEASQLLEEARIAEERAAKKAKIAESARVKAQQLAQDAKLAKEVAAEQARVEEQAKVMEQAKIAKMASDKKAKAAQEARLKEKKIMAQQQAAALAKQKKEARMASEKATKEFRIAKAKSDEKQRMEAKARVTQAKAAEKARMEEEAKVVKAKAAEKARTEEEARVAKAKEGRRVAEEARIASQQAAKKARVEEEARIAKQKADEKARAVKAAKAEEKARRVEEALLAEEEARLAEEEAELSEEEMFESIRMAQSLDGPIAGARAMEDDWEAARQLAQDLAPANEAENKRKTSAKVTTSKVAETLNVVEKKEAGEKRRHEEIAVAARRAVDMYEAELAAKEQGENNARIPTSSATTKGGRMGSQSGT
eukprot:scaffold8852_cov38-Attheya_sp.AAC.1